MESRWDRTILRARNGRPRAKGVWTVCGLGFKGMSSQPRSEIGVYVRASRISLDASAAVCRSNLFHAKVRLRGEPRSSSSCRHLPRQLTMKAREFGMRPYLIVVASRSSVECAMHASCVRHAMRIRLLCLAGEVLTSPATPREGSLRSSCVMGAYEEQLRTTDRLGAT